MNRSICDVYQQQFKTESGLSWHTDRMPERRIRGINLQSIALPSDREPVDLESKRADNGLSPEKLDAEQTLEDIGLRGVSMAETDQRDVLLEKLGGSASGI